MRQSVGVYTRYPDIGVFLTVQYDVVERVVQYQPRSGLWEPNTLYTVVVRAPNAEGDPGFRAFDHAALDGPDGGEHVFTFRTSTASAPDEPPAAPPTCQDALSVFAASGCAASECHGGDAPAAGLDLGNAHGLETTALRRVARETETGGTVGQPLVDPERFGTRMPIIDPGSAARSYLLYKLLAKPENHQGGPCETRYRASPEGACPAPSANEVDALRRYFVQLDPMPPQDRAVSSVDALRTIAAFIDSGAPLAGCR